MRPLVPFPGLPSPGMGMRAVKIVEYFKVKFDVNGLSIDHRYARILAQLIPHVGVVPITPPYMAETFVLLKGL